MIVDETQADEQIVTVEDGETTEIDLTHTFLTPGESEVTVEAEITIFETDFSDDETVSVTVLEPEPTTVEGVTVQLDPEMEDDILDNAEAVAELLGIDFGNEASILYLNGELWVAINDTPIETGYATIEGVTANSNDWDAIDLNVILVESVSVETEGSPVLLEDLREDPSAYHETLVRITDDYQQVSYVLELAEGQFTQQSATGGFATDNDLDLLPPGQAGQWAAMYLSSPEVGDEQEAELEDWLGSLQPTVQNNRSHTFWMDAKATIDAVVLATDEVVTLHVTDQSIHSTVVDDLESILTGSHDGEIVTIQATAAELQLSIKQSLLAVAPCGPDSVNLGIGCMPILGDAVVHGGVLYDGISTDHSELLLYAGISNKLQNVAVDYRHEVVEVTGEVVSASEIDPAFEEQRALAVFDIEPVESVDGEVPNTVTEYQDELEDLVLQQAEAPLGEYEPEPELPIEEYTEEDGTVQTDGLRDAIDDWREGDTDTDLLRDVIDLWRSGEQIG